MIKSLPAGGNRRFILVIFSEENGMGKKEDARHKNVGGLPRQQR